MPAPEGVIGSRWTEKKERGFVLSVLIDRISINGKRYVASERKVVIENYCAVKNIPMRFIRFSERHQKYYLRLWGRYKKSHKVKNAS